MSGKGSNRRPQQIDNKTMEVNWNRIFQKQKYVSTNENVLGNCFKNKTRHPK